MAVTRRSVLKAGAAVGLAGAVGIAGWELSKLKTTAKIVIVGGGAGGIGLANQLLTQLSGAEITVIDPRGYHWYQPGQTLLLAGAYQTENDVVSANESYLDSKINWVADEVVAYEPDNNHVVTAKGEKISYDFLVVASGLELRYDMIEGLDVAQIGQDYITSIYLSPEAGVASHQQALGFARSGGGNAVFTRPQGAMKCAGAPMKATNLVEFFVRSAGQRDAFQFDYFTSEHFLFSVKAFDKRLRGIWQERAIAPHYQHTLTAIDTEAKTAQFQKADGTRESVSWDFIHIAPPMTAVASVRNSALADQTKYHGYVEVDQFTMRHKRFDNVFALGDTAGTPIGKTAASVKSQIPVITANIRALLEQQEPVAKWDGYTSCPMILDVGHAMLWEFDYSLEPITALPFEVVDPLEVSELAWVMEKSLIKPVYDLMLHGYTPI